MEVAVELFQKFHDFVVVATPRYHSSETAIGDFLTLRPDLCLDGFEIPSGGAIEVQNIRNVS